MYSPILGCADVKFSYIMRPLSLDITIKSSMCRRKVATVRHGHRDVVAAYDQRGEKAHI